MINSRDVEREFGKIQHLFITKTLRKQKMGGNFLNLIKRTYEKPTSNIILDGKNLNISLLLLGKRQGFLLTFFFFFFSELCGGPAQCNKTRKKKKGHIIRKNEYKTFYSETT